MSQALLALDSVKSECVNNNQCDYWQFDHNDQDILAKSEGVCVGPFVYTYSVDLRDSDKSVPSVSDPTNRYSDTDQREYVACKEIPKGRFSNIEDGLESSVGTDAKNRINRILDDVKSLTDVEKLLLYLKLPNGATGGGDTYRKTPTSCLHASNRIEQAQAYRWIKSHLEEDLEICVPKQEVFQDYRMYCESHNIGVLSTADFGKVMKCVFPNVKPRRLGQRGQSKYCYGGLKKKMSDQPPMLPEIEIRPRKLQDDADDASELFKSSCQLVCEWAEKLLGTSFDGGVRDLAEYLVSNLYVSSKSVAAFTIIAAMQESGLLHSKVSSLFSSKSGGDSHRETQLQLQRKITERELRKEQQRKVKIQREENESELHARDGTVLVASPSPHKILLSPVNKTCPSQKQHVPPLIISKQITAKGLSLGIKTSMLAADIPRMFSGYKRMSSESDDSMIHCEVGEEENVFDNMHVAEPPLAVHLEQIENMGVKLLKPNASLDFSPFILQKPAVIPAKCLDIEQRTAIEENANTNTCSSNTIVQSLDRLKYVVLNPSLNEQCLSGELTNIASDKTLVLDSKSVSSRSAFIPFSQTVQSRGEQHSLPSVQSYPSSEMMICENSEDTVDIYDVMNKHEDEYPSVSEDNILKLDSNIEQVMSDSVTLVSNMDGCLSLPEDTIMSASSGKNLTSPSTPRKTKSRFTPIRPKAVPTKSISTMLKEQQGHKHDGLDSRPVSKILKERRAKEAQAEVLAQISTSLQSQNSSSFPPSLKLTGPVNNMGNNPRDIVQLPLGMAGKEVVIILNTPGSVPTPATILSPVKTPVVPFSTVTISQSNHRNILCSNVAIRPVSVLSTVSSKSGPCVSANKPDCVSVRLVIDKKTEPESRSQSAKMEQNAGKDLNSSNNSSRPSSACSRDADTPSFCRKRKSSDKGGNSLVPKRMNSLEEKIKDRQSVWSEGDNMDAPNIVRQTKSCTLDLGEHVFDEIQTIHVKERQFCPDISSVESDALIDSTLNIDSIATSSAQESNAMHKVQTTSVGVSAKSFRSSQTRLLKQKQLLDERMKSFMKKGCTSLSCDSSKLSSSNGNPDWFTKYSAPNISFSDMVQTMKDSNSHQSMSQMEIEGLIENEDTQMSMQLSPMSHCESEKELPEDVADFITEAMAAKESQHSSLDQRPFDLAEWHLALPSSFSSKVRNRMQMENLADTESASSMLYTVENVDYRKLKDEFTVPAVPPKQDASQLQKLLNHSSDPQKNLCISLPRFNKPCRVQDQRTMQTPFSLLPSGNHVAYLQSQTLSPSQTSSDLPSLPEDSAVNQVDIKVICVADQQNLCEKKRNKLEPRERIKREGSNILLTQHVATTTSIPSSLSDEKYVAKRQSNVIDMDKNNRLPSETGFISPIQPVLKCLREPTVDQRTADASVGVMNLKHRTPVDHLENTQISPSICPVRRKREISLDRLSNQTPLSDAGYHSIGASPILNSTPVSSGNADSTFNATNKVSSISTRSDSTQSSVNDTVSESPGLSFVYNPQASTPLPFISQDNVQEIHNQSPIVSPGASAFMPIHSTSQTINRYVTPIRPIVTVANTVISSLPVDISEQEFSPEVNKRTMDATNKLPAERNDEAMLPHADPEKITINASFNDAKSYCSAVDSKAKKFKDPPSYESAVSLRKDSRITENAPVSHHLSNKSKSVLSCILEQTDPAQKTNIPVISKDVSGNDSSSNGSDKSAPLSELSSAFPFSYKLAMLSNHTVVKKTPASESVLAKLAASERDQHASKINSSQDEGKNSSDSDFSSKICETDSEEEKCSLSDTVPGDCTIIHHRASIDSNKSQMSVVSTRTTKDDHQSTAGCILSTVDINGVTRVFYNSEVSVTAKESTDQDADSPKSTTLSVSPKSNKLLLPVAVTANLNLKNVQNILKYTKNVVLPSVNYIGSAPNIDIRNVLETPSKPDKAVGSSFEDERVFTVRKDLSKMLEENSSINEEELQTTLEDLRSLDSQYF